MGKIISIFIVVILGIILFVCCRHNLIFRNDECYNEFEEAFAIVNNKMLQLPNGFYDFEENSNNDITRICTMDDNSNKKYIDLTEEELKCLNEISDAMYYDFSFIRITDENIFYAGIGPKIYAYSKTGSSPKTWVGREDTRFRSYKIDNCWFALYL